jgi:hypothetical protein
MIKENLVTRKESLESKIKVTEENEGKGKEFGKRLQTKAIVPKSARNKESTGIENLCFVNTELLEYVFPGGSVCQRLESPGLSFFGITIPFGADSLRTLEQKWLYRRLPTKVFWIMV